MGKLLPGTKVKILSTAMSDAPRALKNRTGVFTGEVDDNYPIEDEDYDRENDDQPTGTAYLIDFGPTNNEGEYCVWFFEEQFQVLKKEYKQLTEIEWLDAVKNNFQEG